MQLLPVLLAFLLISCSHTNQEERKTVDMTKQPPDRQLVLVHGLANKHRWSEPFLDKLVAIWGSGNVFAVYTNIPEIISYKELNSGTMIYCGKSNKKGGNQNIETQTGLIGDKIQHLQRSGQLGKTFFIIAHSMGGLVSRRYIEQHPGTVRGLVTLGTPHHGSPLADSFDWAGYFIGASEAIKDLRPEALHDFNKRFPPATAPLAEDGKIYTIRGQCSGPDCFGRAGELFVGWTYLKKITGKDNDGLVPFDSALIDGSDHIGDYPDYDHYNLVREVSVAEKASAALLNN